ncbi:MAG TPA: aldo/keto reductase [Actinomycetota bacterium]|jgi:aryl-alcohol dehydrogenase-like predicted oxidoreductase|nr:aldo/keto reductase [Actinomycetota bacterium]
MRYTLLGRTGLRVSQFCLGTANFGEDWSGGASKEVCADIVETFVEAGGNFIDTANFYTNGTAEQLLGDLVSGDRGHFVLGTKYTLQTRPGDVNAAGNHRKNLVDALESSLQRLRTDYIDLYWVHVRDAFTPVEEIMRALDDQVRRGKVLYAGVSNWPAWEIAHANTLAELRAWSPFVGLETQYNLLERTPERDLLPMARAFELTVLAWGALAQGVLTRAGGSSPAQAAASGQPDEVCGRDVLVREDMRVRAERVVPALVAIAREGGWTPAQVALAWLRTRPGPVIPILGVSSRGQLRENLGSMDVRLDDPQLRRLDEVSRVDEGFPHDFLRDEQVKQLAHGDAWRRIDHQRARAVATELSRPQPPAP